MFIGVWKSGCPMQKEIISFPDLINSYSDWIILKQKENLEGWNLLEGQIIA